MIKTSAIDMFLLLEAVATARECLETDNGARPTQGCGRR